MTKAEHILQVYCSLPDTPQRTRRVAEIIGCRPEYVRVVARQRFGGGASEIDRRYRQSPLGLYIRNEWRKRKYRNDPAFRERKLKSDQRWYWERGGREWRREYNRQRRAEHRA